MENGLCNALALLTMWIKSFSFSLIFNGVVSILEWVLEQQQLIRLKKKILKCGKALGLILAWKGRLFYLNAYVCKISFQGVIS